MLLWFPAILLSGQNPACFIFSHVYERMKLTNLACAEICSLSDSKEFWHKVSEISDISVIDGSTPLPSHLLILLWSLFGSLSERGTLESYLFPPHPSVAGSALQRKVLVLLHMHRAFLFPLVH